jgi:hypothetical protein
MAHKSAPNEADGIIAVDHDATLASDTSEPPMVTGRGDKAPGVDDITLRTLQPGAESALTNQP